MNKVSEKGAQGSIKEIIRKSIEESKEDIVKLLEEKIRKDFKNRIEELETRIEKNVEDFFMKKFDSMFDEFIKGLKEKPSGKSQDIKSQIHEILDIQEELISKLHQKQLPEPETAEKFRELTYSVNENKKEIKRIISEIEELKKMPRSFPVKEIEELKNRWDEKFFEINKRLEETKKILLGEISRVENEKVSSSGTGNSDELNKIRSEMLSRIEKLENENYELKRHKKSSGAIIVE